MFVYCGMSDPVADEYVGVKRIGLDRSRTHTSLYVTSFTRPPRLESDLMRIPLELPPLVSVFVPSIERSYTLMSDTPPVNSLPIDMPCPASKWLCAMTRWVTPVELEPLMAM